MTSSNLNNSKAQHNLKHMNTKNLILSIHGFKPNRSKQSQRTVNNQEPRGKTTSTECIQLVKNLLTQEWTLTKTLWAGHIKLTRRHYYLRRLKPQSLIMNSPWTKYIIWRRYFHMVQYCIMNNITVVFLKIKHSSHRHIADWFQIIKAASSPCALNCFFDAYTYDYYIMKQVLHWLSLI